MCCRLTCSEQPTARQPITCCYINRYKYISLLTQKYLSLTRSVVIRCTALLLMYISHSYKIMTSIFWDVERTLFVEFLNRDATINFRAISADITEDKTTNLKVLAK